MHDYVTTYKTHRSCIAMLGNDGTNFGKFVENSMSETTRRKHLVGDTRMKTHQKAKMLQQKLVARYCYISHPSIRNLLFFLVGAFVESADYSNGFSFFKTDEVSDFINFYNFCSYCSTCRQNVLETRKHTKGPPFGYLGVFN